MGWVTATLVLNGLAMMIDPISASEFVDAGDNEDL